MSIFENLLYMYELAAEERLDSFLKERGVPDFDEDLPLPEPQKFGSRPAFDRSTFDFGAYSSEIERHFKK
jgi:hypothetical protein